MKAADIPVLVTTCIRSVANNTLVRDESERLAATMAGLAEWFSRYPEASYVICDGSDFAFDESLMELGKRIAMPRNIETLRFRNDAESVRTLGKGYGEGEIVEYALSNSTLITAAGQFAKCTGKLWVPNFGAIAARYNREQAFDYHGNARVEQINTRFYICSVETYRARFAKAYVNVDEGAGKNLEHCFADVLRELPLHQWIMYPAPAIFGLSGSMGTLYMPGRANTLMRSARAALYKLLHVR